MEITTENIKYVFGEYFIWFLWVAVYLALGIFNPALYSLKGLQSVILEGSILGFLAIGMTFTFFVGEIDLSVVYIGGFSALISMALIKSFGLHPLLGIIATLLIGIGFGVFNGLLITRLNVPSLIQTLATWWMLAGAMIVWTKGIAVSNFPKIWTWIGTASIGPVRILVLAFIAVFILTYLYQRYGISGSRFLLVGGDREASRRRGISVKNMILLAFVISALFSAFGMYCLTAKNGVISVGLGEGLLMPAIAAPVIAGISLSGGKGRFLNVPAGVFLIQTILVFVRTGPVSGYYFQLAQGIMVFIAILVSAVRETLRK